MSYCRFMEGDVYAFEHVDGGVQFFTTRDELNRRCNTFAEAYEYIKELRDVHKLTVPSYAIQALGADANVEAKRMSGIDTTHRRRRVADPLREWARETTDEPEIIEMLDAMADEIDAEHKRRMDQARTDSRKATCNYLSRIIADYKRGKKWKRKEYDGVRKEYTNGTAH